MRHRLARGTTVGQVRPVVILWLAVARVLKAGALGLGLWALWIVLWRDTSGPVVAGGAAFVLLLIGLTLRGKLRLEQPASAWLRWDLWLVFFCLVALRVVQAVAVAGMTVLSGRTCSGIVAVPVTVKSDVARLLLLWSITVTPGTIALLLEGDLLYVHCLHQPPVSGLPGLPTFQRLLGRLWG